MRRALALVLLILVGEPARAAPRIHQTPRPPLELAPAPPASAADATMTATGSATGRRLGTLDLDDLVPVRLRLTIPF